MQPEILISMGPKIVEVVEIVESRMNLLRDWDRPGVGETQKSSPGQQIMSVSVPMLGVASSRHSSVFHTSGNARCGTSASTRF